MTEVWTNAEVALLQVWVQQGKRSNEIVKLLTEHGIERTQKAITRKLARETAKDPYAWHAMVAQPTAERFDKPVVVKADRAMVICDPHAPMHDADWINGVMGIAMALKCSTFGVAGDLIDFVALSKFGRQERIECEQEIKAAKQLLSALSANFETVVYSAGNHEMRLPRATNNNLSLLSTMEMLTSTKNIFITDYHWHEIISGGRRIRAEHPKEANRKASTTASQLCAKYHLDTICGHNHVWGQSPDISGTWLGIDIGPSVDSERLAYVTKVHDTRPMALPGAVLILDGDLELIGPRNLSTWKHIARGTLVGARKAA